MRAAEGHRVVGIGGMQSPSRALTAQEWVALIRPWSQGRSFWICSAPADRSLADTLCLEFAGKAQRFDGTFDQMCDLVARAEEVLTVDSGFLHIASYFGVPVTAHFTSGRARKWAALSPNSTILRRSDLACQPCTLFGQVSPCPNHFACKDLTHAKYHRAV
jgi:ADP-heptose:LPS heptosyltransferase